MSANSELSIVAPVPIVLLFVYSWSTSIWPIDKVSVPYLSSFHWFTGLTIRIAEAVNTDGKKLFHWCRLVDIFPSTAARHFFRTATTTPLTRLLAVAYTTQFLTTCIRQHTVSYSGVPVRGQKIKCHAAKPNGPHLSGDAWFVCWSGAARSYCKDFTWLSHTDAKMWQRCFDNIWPCV